MSEPGAGPAAEGSRQAVVPEGLVSAVVNLVNTGPVLLGAYTIAELTAVDAVVDFLETRPSDEVLAEAVRSLAARQLLVPGSDAGQVQVRGDLGIAVAFEQRARMVLDARVSGTKTGEPWRVLLLPQPEKIYLQYRIDALGVHDIGLYQLDQVLSFMTGWLPGGPLGDPDPAVGPDRLLASAERSALISVTRFTTQGSAEIAGATADLVLARHDGRLHILTRDPEDRDRLIPRPADGKDIRDTLTELLT